MMAALISSFPNRRIKWKQPNSIVVRRSNDNGPDPAASRIASWVSIMNMVSLVTSPDVSDRVRPAGLGSSSRALAVLTMMRNEPLTTPRRRLDLAHRPELAAAGEGIRPASLYDQLARAGEEVAV